MKITYSQHYEVPVKLDDFWKMTQKCIEKHIKRCPEGRTTEDDSVRVLSRQRMYLRASEVLIDLPRELQGEQIWTVWQKECVSLYMNMCVSSSSHSHHCTTGELTSSVSTVKVSTGNVSLFPLLFFIIWCFKYRATCSSCLQLKIITNNNYRKANWRAGGHLDATMACLVFQASVLPKVRLEYWIGVGCYHAGTDFRGCPSERKGRVNNVTGGPWGMCQGKHCMLRRDAKNSSLWVGVCMYLSVPLLQFMWVRIKKGNRFLSSGL